MQRAPCCPARRVVCTSQEPPEPDRRQGQEGFGKPRVGDADAVIKTLAGISKAQGRDVLQTGRNLVLAGDESWDELDQKVNSYPLVREFKCIGSGGEDFVTSLLAAAVEVTQRPLRREEVVVRFSRNRNYQSVSIWIEVMSGEEVKAVYAALRKDPRLRYFL